MVNGQIWGEGKMLEFWEKAAIAREAERECRARGQDSQADWWAGIAERREFQARVAEDILADERMADV